MEQICPLCRLAAEDLQHVLLRCPALPEVRSPLFSSIRQLLISHLGSSWWLTRSGPQIVRLCVDSTNIKSQTQSAIEECFLERLEMLGRHFCHKLHIQRLQLYSCPMKTHHSSDAHICGLLKAVQNCVIYKY